MESFAARWSFYHVIDTLAAGKGPAIPESTMKLQLITLSVLAYTGLAIACICYAELALP